MGACHYACSIFCLLAGVILTVFWLITAGDDESNTNLTFMIVAVKSEWNLKEKSDSCRNGAFIYYALSVALVIWGFISNKRETSRIEQARLARLNRRANVDTPLLENDSSLQREVGVVAPRNGNINASNTSLTRKEARQSEDTDASLLASGSEVNVAKKTV